MIYRGYDITQREDGKFVWTDERGFVHDNMGAGHTKDEDAYDDIDRYKRSMRDASK